MTKPALKVGDPVRMIGYDFGGVSVDGVVGTVRSGPNEDGDLDVGTRDMGNVFVKPSQCRLRRLKPKRKPRSIWVNVYANMLSEVYLSEEEADKGKMRQRIACVEFVEKIKKAGKG